MAKAATKEPVEPVGYVARNVVVRMDAAQALKVRTLYDELLASKERLADGRIVRDPADAIRWLIEQH